MYRSNILLVLKEKRKKNCYGTGIDRHAVNFTPRERLPHVVRLMDPDGASSNGNGNTVCPHTQGVPFQSLIEGLSFFLGGETSTSKPW